ncbi:MAG: protein kinase domain-containing protein, partial [Ktedonobacteraceae bacterium]
MDEIIGTTLGQYHLVRLLARGGMSEVYLASRENSEQPYAIKVVHEEDVHDCLRFQREVQTLMTTKHPHIIPILDDGQQAGVYYYVMPYIECGS